MGVRVDGDDEGEFQKQYGEARPMVSPQHYHSI
jgi:hypothetical protein